MPVFDDMRTTLERSKNRLQLCLDKRALKDPSNFRLNCNNLNSYLTLHCWAPFLGAQYTNLANGSYRCYQLHFHRKRRTEIFDF